MSRPTDLIHPSNLLTYLSIVLGILAIRGSGTSLHPQSLICICLAGCAILDSLDGKFARRFKRSEELQNFGMQLDNFVDLFVFGAVPWISFAGMRHSLAFPLPWTFWTASFLYFLSAATRLGFYQIRAEQGEAKTFIGVPTTLIGMTWAIVLGMHPGMMSVREAILLLTLSAVLMVAPLRIPRPSLSVLMALILTALLLMAKATVDLIGP